jgi:hypothetical protein
MSDPSNTGTAGGFIAARALGLAMLALLVLPSAAGAQDDPTESTSSSVTDGAARARGQGAASASPSRPGLAERTNQLNPGRFNLSADGGIGLIRAASPAVLRPGEVAVSVSVLNYDRNPGDIDFFHYSVQGAVGVPGRLELFIRASPALRSNAVNLDPTGHPVPPLDLFVDVYPVDATRPEPYFLFAQEAPFKSYYLNSVTIDPPGHGAFGVSTGDVVIGATVDILSQDRGQHLGVGARGYVEIPTESPGYNVEDWRRAAGTSGYVDFGADLLLSRQIGPVELLVNAGYKRVGDPDEGLRVQIVDSSRWGSPGFLVGAPVDTRLNLHDHLALNGGAAMPAFNIKGLQFWLLGELGYLRYVGPGTRVERLVHPTELRLGIQANIPKYPRVSVGAAWQLLLNDAGDGTTRRSRFRTPDGRGDINFTDQVDWELAAVIKEQFAAQGATFRDRTSKVFATDNPAFDSWRNVPAGDTPVVGMGGGNILGFVTWRIN